MSLLLSVVLVPLLLGSIEHCNVAAAFEGKTAELLGEWGALAIVPLAAFTLS